jgi:hypothetical protein
MIRMMNYLANRKVKDAKRLGESDPPANDSAKLNLQQGAIILKLLTICGALNLLHQFLWTTRRSTLVMVGQKPNPIL